jgi:glucosylceramidase
VASSINTIEVNEASTFQTVDGFGYTLTGGSAYLINNMAAADRSKLLNEMFGNSATSIGVSYLRLGLGASDLSPFVFSYNDLAVGQTDESLAKFSLAADTTDLIPVLKEILAINPNIKLMASPWSAPLWMKTNGSSIGGNLQAKYYSVYAQYFVKYLQAMKAKGIAIDAVTVQNEPQHGGNNPSMVMSANEQADFVKNHLGPSIKNAGLTTKIIIWDHNCDNPNYPISILNDAAAKAFIAGSAFHLYGGDITALSQVKQSHPDKDVYFTEQWTGKNGSFEGDLQWHLRNVIIGSMNNWAKVALEWNLANDPSYGPHTAGGCTECKGALTISGNTYVRNVAYYIIAQASKFVPAGSVRISSFGPGNLPSVAFKTPSGKKVLLVLNDATNNMNFSIKENGKWAVGQIPANTVATYVW